jgi:hypothetical protein
MGVKGHGMRAVDSAMQQIEVCILLMSVETKASPEMLPELVETHRIGDDLSWPSR